MMSNNWTPAQSNAIATDLLSVCKALYEYLYSSDNDDTVKTITAIKVLKIALDSIASKKGI